jgi:hypothetical protein
MNSFSISSNIMLNRSNYSLINMIFKMLLICTYVLIGAEFATSGEYLLTLTCDVLALIIIKDLVNWAIKSNTTILYK